MAHKVSAVLPSASAPDLRRSRLEKLLSQAKPTPAPSEISRTSRRSAPGGAPYPGAPPVRLATGSRQSTAARQLPSRLTSAASALRLTQQSSTPAISPSRPTEERRSQTGSSKAPELGSYIKQLVGDEQGDGMQHWRLVSEVDAIDSLMQESLERHRAAEQKAKQRHVLEEQVREAQKKDNEFKSSRMNWGSKLQADADQWQQEERSRKVLQQEMQRKFNEEQARHAEEGRRRKDEERQQVAALEHSLVQQAEIEKARQEEAEGRRRRKQQEMAKQMADAAKEAQEKKALKKHEEAQKDLSLMKAQIALMDQQERQRAQNLQRIRDKQGQAQAQFEAGAGNEAARLRQEEEERARRWQEDKQARDEAALQEKKHRTKQMHMDGVAFLTRQLQEQKDVKAAEKEEQRRCREREEQLSAAELEKERRKVLERKKREQENAQFLQQQIDQKSASKRSNDQMTQVEQSMNKARLQRATEPKTLQMLVQNKMRQCGLPGE